MLTGFANNIYMAKYSKDGKEEWPDTARRVTDAVMRPLLPELADEMLGYITARKFIPGGRYLYAAGRRVPQTNNCLLLRATDSREGWGELLNKTCMALMTGAGIGVDYSDIRPRGSHIGGMGGESSGPLSLMMMVNEVGRHVMQGGTRRSAIWAGLNWAHLDVLDFVGVKDWNELERASAEQGGPAPMDCTNVSVILDEAFFAAYNDPYNLQHEHAHKVYDTVIEKMLTTGEPGFSCDLGDNKGETLRNAPVGGDTLVLTSTGYRTAYQLSHEPATIYTGKQWVSGVKFLKTMVDAPTLTVSMTGGRVITCEPSHEFLIERTKMDAPRPIIQRIKARDLKPGDVCHVALPEHPSTTLIPEAYALGWAYGAGMAGNEEGELRFELTTKRQQMAEIHLPEPTTRAHDASRVTLIYTRPSWLEGQIPTELPEVLSIDEAVSLLAGICDSAGHLGDSTVRFSSHVETLLDQIARLCEFAGIRADVTWYDNLHHGVLDILDLRAVYHALPLKVLVVPLDWRPLPPPVKVVSVQPGDNQDVYCCDVGVPEHSFIAEGVVISNCTEITSRDSDDVCNLGSINLARVESKQEFARIVELGVAFLLCGSVYSVVPYSDVATIRDKNRRLGLGLMGLAEWLAVRGKRLGPDPELADWLEEYAKSTDLVAGYAARLGTRAPVKTRAIAPVGTISIIGETTSGCEPPLAHAYRRRYLVGADYRYEYVIDATVERLIDKGVNPADLDTAYSLAGDPERRIRWQAWLQTYVDHGISSTLNLPPREQQAFTPQEFGEILMHYLPLLRGITAFPDGSRGRQPFVAVPYDEAVAQVGVVFDEVSNSSSSCASGVCGL